MHRIFIAINIPEKVKEELNREVDDYLKPVFPESRFIERKNWHLTIIFLGDQDDQRVYSATQAIKEAAAKFEEPEIKLEKITYGPLGKKPKMVWLVGGVNTGKRLGLISEKLTVGLENKGVFFKESRGHFSAHVTLLRFNSYDFKLLKRLPLIDKKINITFTAKSLDLMESSLLPDGARYETLFSASFQNQ